MKMWKNNSKIQINKKKFLTLKKRNPQMNLNKRKKRNTLKKRKNLTKFHNMK